MLRYMRDAISSGGRRSIGNKFEHCHCQAFWDGKFLSPPERQAPLPVRISQPYL